MAVFLHWDPSISPWEIDENVVWGWDTSSTKVLWKSVKYFLSNRADNQPANHKTDISENTSSSLRVEMTQND